MDTIASIPMNAPASVEGPYSSCQRGTSEFTSKHNVKFRLAFDVTASLGRDYVSNVLK